MGSDTAPLLLSILDTQKQLGGLSKGSVYNLINAGEITKVNIGRRGFVTSESIAAYLDRLQQATAGGAA